MSIIKDSTKTTSVRAHTIPFQAIVKFDNEGNITSVDIHTKDIFSSDADSSEVYHPPVTCLPNVNNADKMTKIDNAIDWLYKNNV